MAATASFNTIPDVETAGFNRDEPAPKPSRRRGPMSPEEMVDLRNQQLRVDEEMVDTLIAEAKADYSVNLLEPFQGMQHPVEVARHRRRLIKVLGATAQFRSNGKMTLLALGATAGVFACLHFNDEMGIVLDLIFAVLFGTALSVLIYFHTGYTEAFRRLYAVERRDFTDPGHATGVVRIYVPALTFYKRPDVWRGDDGHNGIRSNKSFIVVSCGQDTIKWNYNENDPDWDADVWCTVTPGAKVTDFRTPADYYDLPPDTYTADIISMKHRRAWLRDLMVSGTAYGAWEKGSLGILDGKWGWLGGGALLVVALFLMIFAMG